MIPRPATPGLEFLTRATIELEPMLAVGPTPRGERRIYPIAGGRFEGERLSGTVLPGGADWQLIGADGSAELDARYTLRTDDDALVYVQNRGMRHGPADVLAALTRGDAVHPAAYYFRATPRFETGDARYAWLNRAVAVCSGARLAQSVVLDFYTVQ